MKNNEMYVIAFGDKYLCDPMNAPINSREYPDKLIDWAAKFANKDEALKVAKLMKKAEGKTLKAPVKLIKISIEEVDING